ncbi:MAG: AAA family ATPase [Chitinophagaceae bacterium]|nr:AAA family ATPase [Chitinophagaceae bacterium]
MFTNFHISNFKTHVDSDINIEDVILITGDNNSGKSNLLAGLSFFSKLVSSAFPESKKNKELKDSYYFSNKNVFSNNDTPISFSAHWNDESAHIKYSIELYCQDSNVGCREKLDISLEDRNKVFEHGFHSISRELLLRTQIQNEELDFEFSKAADIFFKALASLYYYNFQSALLKGMAYPAVYANGQMKPSEKRDFIKEFKDKKAYPHTASELGKEGSNFLSLIKFIKEKDIETYNKFIGSLKKFQKTFIGIHIHKDQIAWQFEEKNSLYPFFSSDKTSDGFIKIATIALLCSLKKKPSVIMIEDIESCISYKNMSLLIQWLIEISQKGERIQFIFTSYNPLLIKEFSDKLTSVYIVSTEKNNQYISNVTDAEKRISFLAKQGHIDQRKIINKNGATSVDNTLLMELIYNGNLLYN